VAKFLSISPIFKLSSRERWRPVGVEESCTAAGIAPPPLAAGRNLDFPPDMRPPELPVVLYHRVAQAGNLSWHQFWSWWPYNPKTYAGMGAHEGDWELVQIGCADPEGERPVLVTCSQHSGGEKRMWHRVALGTPDPRPVIYVARDSHANYFAPERSATDVADGQGVELVHYSVRELDAPWVPWKGRWGNSDSSPGPLVPRRAWQAPHAYHDQARG
jgi:hypothetical protein